MRRRIINIKLTLFQNKGLDQGYLLLLFRQVTTQPPATEGQVIPLQRGLEKPQYKSGR